MDILGALMENTEEDIEDDWMKDRSPVEEWDLVDSARRLNHRSAASRSDGFGLEGPQRVEDIAQERFLQAHCLCDDGDDEPMDKDILEDVGISELALPTASKGQEFEARCRHQWKFIA